MIEDSLPAGRAPWLVSIVMPSLNQAAFISDAILSVLEQSWRHLELIVVDGVSRDGTAGRVASLRARDARLVWSCESDNGPAQALNQGFGRARGDIIGWLNADDLYAPDAIRQAVEAFQAHPDWLMLYGRGQHVDSRGHPLGEYPTLPPSVPVQRFGDGCFICQPTVFFRRGLFEQVGWLDEDFRTAFDFEFWVRVFTRLPGRIGFIDRIQARSRLHDSTITRRERKRVALEATRLLRRHLGSAPSHWLLTYLGERLRELAESAGDGDPILAFEADLAEISGHVDEASRAAYRVTLETDWRFAMARQGVFIGVGPDSTFHGCVFFRRLGACRGLMLMECRSDQAPQSVVDVHLSPGGLSVRGVSRTAADRFDLLVDFAPVSEPWENLKLRVRNPSSDATAEGGVSGPGVQVLSCRWVLPPVREDDGLFLL